MKRANITISDELHEYYKNRSKRTGITMSALMAIQLEKEYNEQNAMSQLPDLLKAFNELQEGNKK